VREACWRGARSALRLCGGFAVLSGVPVEVTAAALRQRRHLVSGGAGSAPSTGDAGQPGSGVAERVVLARGGGGHGGAAWYQDVRGPIWA
jgi:hypothetical protein